MYHTKHKNQTLYTSHTYDKAITHTHTHTHTHNTKHTDSDTIWSEPHSKIKDELYNENMELEDAEQIVEWFEYLGNRAFLHTHTHTHAQIHTYSVHTQVCVQTYTNTATQSICVFF